MTSIKSFFLGLLLLIVGTTTYAQTNKVDLGIEGGPSLIFLRGNDVIDNFHESTIGFSGGLFFQLNFQNPISLRTTLAFERKGSIVALPFTDENGEPHSENSVHSNFDYLTFPVLVRATFGRKARYFINAGPYFGYLLKQTYVSKDDNGWTPPGDSTSDYKRFDTGVSAGLGLSVPIKTKFAASFEVRNNLGLYNVSADPVINDGTVKTNSINLILSFTHKLGQGI